MLSAVVPVYVLYILEKGQKEKLTQMQRGERERQEVKRFWWRQAKLPNPRFTRGMCRFSLPAQRGEVTRF